MKYSKDFKRKYPNLYDFANEIISENLTSESKGFSISYRFKEDIVKELDEIIEYSNKQDFKIKKYEKEKIPMILAANDIFKKKNKTLKDENAILKKENKKNNIVLKKMAEYINSIDDIIWCTKTECDNKCYECVIESFIEKINNNY